MKKLKLAIIGQGRSGRDIHGAFYKTEENVYFEVSAVVEADAARREIALREYPGCRVFRDYTELFGEAFDLVVNASFSQMHYPITKDLLLHGYNVLVEKPFGRTYFECRELMGIAKEKGLFLGVFQQSFLAPHFLSAMEWAKSGKLGDIKQVNVHYSGFSRRWDWQTIQRNCAGGLYNTGPHPVGIALAFLDFRDDVRVEFSRLDTALTSGDADDYAKVVLSAPDCPVVDVEISSVDAFSPYNIKIQGSRGTYTCTTAEYKVKYIVDGENEPRPLQYETLRLENDLPTYCRDNLIFHEESEKFGGSPFSVAVREFYRGVYECLTEGKPMEVTAKMAADVIHVIEQVHAANPLPIKY